ncbi:MAG: helix-turn-helix transcriptional regulator [Burkholderiaceae bacterium]
MSPVLPGAASRRTVPLLKALPRALYSRHERLAPGSVAEAHEHDWGQLSYASSGVLEVRTEAGGFVAPPRHAVWVPAGCRHEVLNHGQTEMRSLYVRAGEATGLPAQCTVLQMSNLARELMARIAQLPVAYDEAGADGRLAAVLLDELARLPQARFQLPLARDRRVRQIGVALQQRPDDRRGLAEWGAAVGASQRTLARLFLRETGLSFGAWRQRLRLLLALQALEAGASVTAASLGHGYESPSAFIVAFRAAFGVTPGEWRGRLAQA